MLWRIINSKENSGGDKKEDKFNFIEYIWE